MYYPKSPCCPEEQWCDKENMPRKYKNSGNCARDEMMLQLQQLCFASYDLQLFLDTHPDDAKAMELFCQINATIESLKSDFENMYGPLTAKGASGDLPFMWVSDDLPWPWMKEGN